MEMGLSLGSNVGDREAHLQQAAAAVARLPDLQIIAQSPIYETEPVDVAEEYKDLPFLNAVLVVEAGQQAEDVSTAVHDIEARMGRKRGLDRNAPRPIDIDIIFAGKEMIDDEDLTVPHPRWAQRRFVVQPLADIRPDLLLPGSEQTVGQVLLSLPRLPEVILFTRDW